MITTEDKQWFLNRQEIALDRYNKTTEEAMRDFLSVQGNEQDNL